MLQNTSMLKLRSFKIVYINVRHEIRRVRMNGILAKSSENKLHGVISPKNPEAVETAGSLAMKNNIFAGWYSAESYDEFTASNPFAIDYSQYADCGDYVADNGFLSSFSNAVSVIGSDGASFSGGSDGGFSGASCGASSGGFTSFC